MAHLICTTPRCQGYRYWRGYGILPSIELDDFESSSPHFTSSHTQRYTVQTSDVLPPRTELVSVIRYMGR